MKLRKPLLRWFLLSYVFSTDALKLSFLSFINKIVVSTNGNVRSQFRQLSILKSLSKGIYLRVSMRALDLDYKGQRRNQNWAL